MAKYRKMLNDWEAPYLQSLVRLAETQSQATLVDWSVGYAAEHLLPIWERKFPDDLRPHEALRAARSWPKPKVEQKEPKALILDCYTAARETEGHPAAQCAARGMANAASSVYATTHSIGLALYGALAVAYDELGENATWANLEQRAIEESWRMETAMRAIAVEKEPNPAKINWGMHS